MIFMDMHKSYDSLDRDRCLEILEGCGLGPRDLRILLTYWGWLRMVTRAGGYYGSDFQGFRGVMQGEPLPPTIFNVVLDTVVGHWVQLMVEDAGRRGKEGRHQNALFYTDDVMLALLYPGWI